MGHEVFIIAPTYSEYDKKNGGIISAAAGEKELSDGIRLVRLKPVLPCKINQHIHIFYGFNSIIERIRPDLVFVHGVYSLNYRFLYRYKKQRPEVQIVYDNHADANNSGKNFMSYNYARYVVKHLIVKRIIDTSNFFYGVTPARCDYLINMFGIPKNKVSLLPLGADDEEMHFDQKQTIRQEVRKQYGISDKDFLIVTGGRIDPLKNIHVLAKAVSKSQHKDIKLLVFGSIRDDMKDVFESLKSDRILLIGWQPSNEVYRFFYAADIVMFPGLHSVLWEQAVASQVPCAFSRIEGFEHVNIGGNCLLMEGKSAEYYEEIIDKIYSDNVLFQELYKNAQSAKSEQFLYSHIARKVFDDIKLK